MMGQGFIPPFIGTTTGAPYKSTGNKEVYPILSILTDGQTLISSKSPREILITDVECFIEYSGSAELLLKSGENETVLTLENNSEGSKVSRFEGIDFHVLADAEYTISVVTSDGSIGMGYISLFIA